MRFYKRLLKFLPVFVILVVLPRVADFIGNISPQGRFSIHDVIRFAFAAALGLGTIATAYFSDGAEQPEYEDDPPNPRERRRREREAVYFLARQNAAPYARRALWLFATLDGTFNLADALMGANSNGLFDAQNSYLVYIYLVATIIFGIAPTILAINLTKVISLVDRIPENYERPRVQHEMDWIRTIMGNLGLREYKANQLSDELPNGNGRHPFVERTNIRPGMYVGEQTARVKEFLRQNSAADYIPGVAEIHRALEEPKPAKSTIHEARNQFIQQYDPYR